MNFALDITSGRKTENLAKVNVPGVPLVTILPDLNLRVAVKMNRGEGEMKLADSESGTYKPSQDVCVKERVNDYENMLQALDDSFTDDSAEKASLNSVPRRTADEDNTFVSSLLTIVPAEELEFCPTEENRDSLDIISLTNITDKHVAYKVKTTSPEKYRVRPSTGVIQPNGHADINVCLHSVPVAGVTKDKFLIMFMEVEPEVPVSQVNELFKVTGRDNYNEHRLRCRLGSMKVVSDSPLLSSSKTSATEQLNKISQQMETLLTSHQRLEWQMGQLRKYIFLLLGIILLFLLTIFLTYWTEYLPVNKYTVNACVPHYL